MKKFITALTAAIAAVFIAVMFAACAADDHTHQFGDWTVVYEATCEEEGLERRSCACGETEERPIKALGHSFGEWVTVSEPTCTEEGLQRRTCSCGETEERSVDIDPSAHIFSDDWSYDASGHWHASECGHTAESERADHDPENGICKVCGYICESTPGLTFELSEDGTYTVTGVGAATQTDIVIASLHEGKPVTAIGASAFMNSNITSIVMADSITDVGDGAFMLCGALEEVTLSANISKLSDGLFHNCSSLREIVIPEKVSSIGFMAFYNCSSLASVSIPESATSIGENAFSGCSGLESVELLCNIETIGLGAFSDCTSLVSIALPDGLTEIGLDAFRGCSSLESVIIPASVSAIETGAFTDCTSLASIYYKGTAEEWSGISIGVGSVGDVIDNAVIYYYSAAQPTAEGNFWYYAGDGTTPVIW